MPNESTRYVCPVCANPLFLVVHSDEEYYLTCQAVHTVADNILIDDVCELIMKKREGDFGTRAYSILRGFDS